RPLDVLACKADIRLGRTHLPGFLGADRPPHRRAPAGGLDHHGPDPRCHGPGPDRAEGRRADERAVVPRPPGFGGRTERDRPALPGRGRAAGPDLRQPGVGRAARRGTAVRAAVHAVPGSDALVGGNTAINLDVQRASAHDRNLIIPIVLLVVFVILALLLRALVAPIMLIATVVLSFAATLGVSALFF